MNFLFAGKCPSCNGWPTYLWKTYLGISRCSYEKINPSFWPSQQRNGLFIFIISYLFTFWKNWVHLFFKVEFIDADTDAFNDYMKALKMPKSTPDEENLRQKAMQDGLKTAVQVPLNLAKKVSGLFEPLVELAKICNINCQSDLEVRIHKLCYKYIPNI